MADPMEREALWNDFHRIVNMTSQELSTWLRVSGAGEHSEQLPERAGAPIGRHVLAILRKRRMDLTDDDLRVMRKVVDLVHEQEAGPNDPASDESLRHRLMALGHNPLRAA